MVWVVLLGILIVIGIIISSIQEKREQKKNEERLSKYKEFIDEQYKAYSELNIKEIQEGLDGLISQYRRNQTILKDKKGNAVNICPKCLAVRKVATSRYGNKFLGCSNYPECSSYGKIERLKNLNIEL